MDFGNEQKHADGNNSAQANGLKLKTLGAAVANKIAPTAQAMEKATGDHWSAAKKDTKDAGGLLADAAVEATNALGETTQRGLEKTQEGLNSAHVQVRGGLQEASDVAQGGKDRLVNDAREMKDGVASHVDENMAHTSTKTVPTTTAHTEGGGVLSSISSGLKSMAGRFTAPISGDEVTDRNVIDKASNSAQNTADTAAQKAQEAKDGGKGVVSTDTRSKAQDAKESTKQAGIDAKDTVKQAGLDAKENAVNAAQSAKDSVAGAARSVQDGIKQTTNDVEDFLTADLSPHSAGEAALQGGLIPSNTADELAAHPTSKA